MGIYCNSSIHVQLSNSSRVAFSRLLFIPTTMSSPPPQQQPRAVPPHLRRPARSNKGLIFGLLAFGLVAFSFPFYYVVTSNLDASKPLSSAAVRRGPYANSGSRDVGPVSVEEFKKKEY